MIDPAFAGWLFTLYSALLLPVIAWVIVRARQSDRPELSRAAAVVLGHWAMLQGWFGIVPLQPGQAQPWLLHGLSLVAVFWLICRIPATRGSAVLGGSVVCGIVASVVYGFVNLWHGYDAGADMVYWITLHTMAWVNLSILLGWTHVSVLCRLADRGSRAAAGLVRAAAARGLAR